MASKKDSKHVVYMHFDSELDTVSKFLDKKLSITTMNGDEFLRYSPPPSSVGIISYTNLQAIFQLYDPTLRKDHQVEFDKLQATIADPKQASVKVSWKHPLLVNTPLSVPSDRLSRDVASMKGKNILSENNNTQAYIADNLRSLLTNPFYKKSQKSANAQAGSVTKEHPTISVWIWMRALSSGGLHEDLEGTIVDISKYVETCQTSVSGTGGNFTITLPPLATKFHNGMWKVDESSMMRTKGGEYASRASLHTITDGELARNNFFFHYTRYVRGLIYIDEGPFGIICLHCHYCAI